MPWKRCGVIYAPATQANRAWAATHAQCPTPDPISDRKLRIYFGTRDADNRTRPTFIDVDPDHLERIQYAHDEPVLELGDLGCFDDLGVIPTCVVNADGAKFLYYAGCNTGTSVPYRMSIGVAVSEDGGCHFRRIHQGPILDRTFEEPHFCSTPFVIRDGRHWRMWYLSCLGWRIVGGRPEPQYHIKFARSNDGLHWERDGSVAVEVETADEAIARPWILPGENRWRMWYCRRSLEGYRTVKDSSYRIGYAESADRGATWVRQDQLGGLATAAQGWDTEMTAYPAIFEQAGRLCLLYNGNGFGQSGFGYATCEEG
jgi:hypothetical protein